MCGREHHVVCVKGSMCAREHHVVLCEREHHVVLCEREHHVVLCERKRVMAFVTLRAPVTSVGKQTQQWQLN
jgi:hypothetical protein